MRRLASGSGLAWAVALVGALVAAALVGATAGRGAAFPAAVRDLARAMYAAGSGVYALVSGPLNDARLTTTVPFLAPVLLGLMGATAPCQLSTGMAAVAFVARDSRPGGAYARAFAFVTGRVLVYAVTGAVVAFLLGGRLEAPGAFLIGVRRALGPAMIFAGLVTFGVLRPRWPAFAVPLALERSGRARGDVVGAFAMGLAFSFAFCPTLFFLFFGLTLPLAATAPGGFLYPSLFAVGMSLPLLAAAVLAAAGQEESGRDLARHLRRWRRVPVVISGAVFLLAGLFDSIVYWFL